MTTSQTGGFNPARGGDGATQDARAMVKGAGSHASQAGNPPADIGEVTEPGRIDRSFVFISDAQKDLSVAALKIQIVKVYKLLQGGSCLIHRSFCDRHRIAALTPNTPNSATSHHGFRVGWHDA